MSQDSCCQSSERYVRGLPSTDEVDMQQIPLTISLHSAYVHSIYNIYASVTPLLFQHTHPSILSTKLTVIMHHAYWWKYSSVETDGLVFVARKEKRGK